MTQGEDLSIVEAAARRVAHEAVGAGVKQAIGWFQEEDQIRALPSFPGFVSTLQQSPEACRFQPPLGLERLAVAWARQASAGQDLASAWAAFWSEVCDPEWHYVSIANLRQFHCDSDTVPFEDGLSIRSRSRAGLAASTGWTPEVLLQTVGADWNESFGGAGSFVVVQEEHVPKNGPFPLANTGLAGVAVGRLLLALRLNGQGDVSAGQLFTLRSTRFPGSPGITSTGPAPRAGFGSGMLFVAARDKPAVDSLYRSLSAFESSRSAKVDALGVALARFDASTSRTWVSQTDRVLDDMIGLEALVGDLGAELSYSIAIRTSGMLAATDAGRVALFKDLRSFYAARSVIVHGRKLKPAQEVLISREPELRDVLRRLLRGYLHLHGARRYASDKHFRDRLDEILLDRDERDKLQAALAVGETAPPDESGGRVTPQWTDQALSQATIIVGGQTITDHRVIET